MLWQYTEEFMTNNFNFIFKCKEYGVDQKDTTTHEEHIILSNKEKGKDILYI
mgnify:CR=1 FL=1